MKFTNGQTDLIKEAVKNLTGTQTLICFVATAVLFTTYKITGKAFDYLGKKKKMELELQKSKIDAEIKKEENKTLHCFDVKIYDGNIFTRGNE